MLLERLEEGDEELGPVDRLAQLAEERGCAFRDVLG
jgi:hypothetical protein